MPIPYELQQGTARHLRLVGALLKQRLLNQKMSLFQRFRLSRRLMRIDAALEVVEGEGK